MKNVPTIIRLKLIRPIGCETAEFYDALRETGKLCDEVRNAMLRFWQRWREDHEDWSPDIKTDKKGNPRYRKNGLPVWANAPAPKVDDDGNPKTVDAMKAAIRFITFTTAMYRHGRLVHPELSSNIVSMCSQEVWKYLRQRAKWQPGLKSFHEWEAILTYEVAARSCRARNIPVPNNSSEISWGDSCTATFTLWSKARTPSRYTVECAVAKLPPGKKKMLLAAIAGEIKISDSFIVPAKRIRGKQGKGYELHLVIKQPAKMADADPANVLRLEATGEDGVRPFLATLPNGNTVPVGHGVALKSVYDQTVLRRKAIQSRHRLGMSKRGHGTRRIMARLAGESRRYQNSQNWFRWSIANNVYRLCQQHDCGTVEYFEPRVTERSETWFGCNDVPFDWTQLQHVLSTKFERRGINLQVVDIMEDAPQDTDPI